MKAIFKVLSTIALCSAFFLMFHSDVLAESVESFDITEGFVLQQFDEEELLDMVENSNTTSYSAIHYGYDYDESDYYKDFGSFELSRGFERERTTTFSETKSLLGVGEEGSIVGFIVFHFEEESSDDESSKLVISLDKEVELGKSGLYNETICFENIGLNYVLIYVETEDGSLDYKLFKVIRKEEETREKLENVQIDFFNETKESPSIEEFVPNIMEIEF